LIKIFGILSWHNREETEIKEYFVKDLLFIIKKPLPIMALVAEEILWYKWRFMGILVNYMSYMEENVELLGSADKSFNFPNQEIRPLVKNWLRDYVIFSGSPKELNSLNFLEYFSQNNNVKLLNQEDLRILKRILKLYSIFSSPLKNSNFFQQPYLFDDYFETGESPAAMSAAEILKSADSLAEPAQANVSAADNPLTGITQKYNEILGQLQKDYEINRGLTSYKDRSLAELFELIKNNPAEAKIVLPALTIIVDRDNNFEEMIKVYRSGGNFIGPIKNILLTAALPEEQAAVYLIHLAKFNQKLLGYAYGDLKQKRFKLK
jgi:hypothetical protein